MLSLSLSLSKGVVPQLVNQYNDLIEHNLCQTIRDNRNNSCDESIVFTDSSFDTNFNVLNDAKVVSDLTVQITVAQVIDIRRNDPEYSGRLVKNSKTDSNVRKERIIKESVEEKQSIKDKEKDSNDRKESEIIENKPKLELSPIKVNPILEYLMVRRKHSFVSKTIVSKEICGICGQSIQFSEKSVQCVDCISMSHIKCSAHIPMPCIRYTNPSLRSTKHISNYVYPAFKPSVPALLIHCIREVEERSHESSANSLYVMKSEALRQVRDLCNQILKSKNAFHLLKNFNTNIICGVIKKFLSDFNESLIGKDIWKQFSYNMKKKSDEELETMLKQSIMELNVTNRDTLSFLIFHLRHLADNQKYIDSNDLIETFTGIVCGDTEVNRKLRLMSILFQINRDFWIKILK